MGLFVGFWGRIVKQEKRGIMFWEIAGGKDVGRHDFYYEGHIARL
jgi:hypothetical protein